MASINHDKKAIYFHIPKTAGSYIQNTLDTHYGFNNYMNLLRPDFDIFNQFNKEQYDIEKDLHKVFPYKNRMFGINNYYSGSEELLEMMILDEGRWEECFKFTFVRDPYARFISSWNFILSTPKISENLLDNDNYEKFENLQYFIDNRDELSDNAYNHIFLTQYAQILNSDGFNDMDFIGKHENLENDLEIVFNKIGINTVIHNKDVVLNKNKVDFNYYKTYYTQEILDFVNSYFDDDFTNFNYKKIIKLSNFLENN